MKQVFSLISILALFAMLALSACSTKNSLTDDNDVTGDAEISLEKEFGGYETSDEAVAFGDSEMLTDFPEDEDANDVYAEDAQVLEALNFPADTTANDPIKAYFLRITFGLLEGDSTATEIIDWSGAAEVSQGTLVVLKKIRFEANDYILPRESRTKVEFVSQTKPHFDGLLLAIIDNDTSDAEGTFTLNAGAYSHTFNLSELDSLELLEPVGDLGHEMSIITRSKEYTPFAGGFLAGRWVKTRAHGGEFRGRWIDSMGLNGGHLKGIWGARGNGNKVFKGKYISVNGEFRGLIAGEWNYDRDENGGTFRGRWINRDRQTVGYLAGKFKTGRAGDRRGFFHGRYHVTNQDNLEGTGL